MAKAKQKIITRGSRHDLDVMFYRRFDPDLLFNKAVALDYLTKNVDRFRKELEHEYAGFDEPFDDRYFASLRAELHFTELHQFESFFAVLTAIFQTEPHWIYLSQYSTGEIKAAIRRYVDGDIKVLTDGRLDTEREFFAHAIYSTGAATDTELRGKWDENLDMIAWLVRRMARRYLDGTASEGGEYNAYKHGLRVMTGHHEIQVSEQNDDGTPGASVFEVATEDSIAYLQFKDIGEGGETVHEMVKYFAPGESFANLTLMHQMLQTVVRTRLARLTADEEPFTVKQFADMDKNRVSELGARNMTIAITI